MSEILALLRYAYDNVLDSLYMLVIPAVFFALLALAIKRGEAWSAARRAGEQVRVNIWLYFLDAVFTVPLMAIVISAIDALLFHWGVTRFQTAVWAGMGTYPTLFLVLFLGDFASYWRHRLEHTSLLWPSHAVHHSDTDMTWLTLERFHPINRLTTTVIDSTFLVLMGFPAWAALANTVVRHYYGYFIHADLPWTYGKFSAVLVSPAMHHWHHARDVRYAGTNFATVFSVFDRAFGTYKGGLCDVPVGLDADMGVGVKGQLAYPFRVWWARFSKRGGQGAGVAERPATE